MSFKIIYNIKIIYLNIINSIQYVISDLFHT